jgi:hypothetical protein
MSLRPIDEDVFKPEELNNTLTINIPKTSLENVLKPFGGGGEDIVTSDNTITKTEEVNSRNKTVILDNTSQASVYGNPYTSNDIATASFNPSLYAIPGNNKPSDQITVKANGVVNKAVGTSQQKNVFTQKIDNVSVNPVSNILNGFASYTYNIELYMLDLNSYVRLMQSPRDFASLPKTLIMRSGGLGPDVSPDADIDFYIQELSFENFAASPSVTTANTNATDIRMQIIEPRGITLLERLKNIANRSRTSTEQHYIHVPYCIRITFKGYDHNGSASSILVPPINIPMRITDFTFDVDTDGTKYDLKGIPFHQTLHQKASAVIPINVQMKATTVNDIFHGKVSPVDNLSDTATEENAIAGGSTSNTVKSNKEFIGLGQVLTDYHKSLTLPRFREEKGKDGSLSRIQVPSEHELFDEYEFNFAEEIANAKLNKDAFNPENSPANTKDKQSKFNAYADNYRKTAILDKETQLFRVNNGTDISKLINAVLLHSDYIESNISEDSSSPGANNKPIKWFKIKPKITQIKGWDNKAGRYKYKIRYDIVPAVMYYSDYPWAPKSKPQGIGVHKIYDYMYTGLNIDVLDFRYKFNTAFMNTMTIGAGVFSDKQAGNTFSPGTNSAPQPANNSLINSPQNLKNIRAKDLFSTVMYSGFDLVDLDLSIVGDPAYLPTADSYWQDKELQNQMYTTAFLPDGTINYDLSAPFIQVNLKTPIDYDSVTGLATPGSNGQYTGSEFSGVYRVTNIKSTFSAGIFEQNLSGFRTPMQPYQGTVARSLYGLQNSSYGNQSLSDNKNSLLSTIFNTLIKNNGTATSLNTSVNGNAVTDIITQILNNTKSVEVNQNIPTIQTNEEIDQTDNLLGVTIDRYTNNDANPDDWLVG